MSLTREAQSGPEGKGKKMAQGRKGRTRVTASGSQEHRGQRRVAAPARSVRRRAAAILAAIVAVVLPSIDPDEHHLRLPVAVLGGSGGHQQPHDPGKDHDRVAPLTE